MRIIPVRNYFRKNGTAVSAHERKIKNVEGDVKNRKFLSLSLRSVNDNSSEKKNFLPAMTPDQVNEVIEANRNEITSIQNNINKTDNSASKMLPVVGPISFLSFLAGGLTALGGSGVIGGVIAISGYVAVMVLLLAGTAPTFFKRRKILKKMKKEISSQTTKKEINDSVKKFPSEKNFKVSLENRLLGTLFSDNGYSGNPIGKLGGRWCPVRSAHTGEASLL